MRRYRCHVCRSLGPYAAFAQYWNRHTRKLVRVCSEDACQKEWHRRYLKMRIERLKEQIASAKAALKELRA